MTYIKPLAGQRILLIGGTSGIGFCIAENALVHGATVIIASSKQSSIDNALSRLHESYHDLAANTSGHVIDLHSPNCESEIISLLKAATTNGSVLLDHIAVTAGDVPPIQPISQFEPATFTNAQQIRLIAPLFLAKHAPNKYLRASNRSSITFTSGNNRPKRNFVVPATIRGAMESMTQALAVDLQPIRVNLVVPGSTDTELFSKRMSSEQLESFRQTFKEGTLTGVIGRPQDVSEAYVYIMRDANVTGQALYSDGGLLLAPGMRS